MTDTERNVIILALTSLKSENPQLWGYARLRKAIFFLQKEEGVPLGFPFKLEGERPVSPQLQIFLEKMKYEGLLNFIETPHGYRIIPGKKGKHLLENNPGVAIRYKKEIQNTFNKIEHMTLTELRIKSLEVFLKNPE
ncbi:MAG: hypothetical protein J7K01_05610 [Thermovirga sp.]|nr:hypothetical protein [Thermovirga sp.]